jgi:ribosome assembly protein YihI (activator of Der GTPase)
MAETSSERLERIIREKKQERYSAAVAAKAAELQALDVDAELNSLNSEISSLTDEQLKAKDRNYLQQKLTKVKELEEEKLRRND